MSTSPNLALPYIDAAQAQKHVTHNDAIRIIDALLHLAIVTRTLSAPPGSLTEGARYIVQAPGAGAWTGHDNQVAAWQDGGWRFSAPKSGWLAYIVDEGLLAAWFEGAWVNAIAMLQGIPMLGVNTTADATNRLAVKSNAVLFSHDDVTPGTGDMRATLNKSATAKDAGYTFQVGFSTRALFGLLGDDNFTIKVSPDGAAFHQGLSIDRSTGHVGLNGFTADANNGLGVKGTAFLFDAETDDCRFTFNKAAVGDDAALTFQTGYSARALIGLLGDDNFTFKVSPDGSTYKTAFVLDKSTGAVDHTEGSKFSAYCNFDKYIAANIWTKIDFNNADHNDQGDFSAGTSTFTAPFAGYYMFGVGFRFKANSTVPALIRVGLGINGANPIARNSVTQGDATVVTLETYVQCVRVLKLAANATVIGMGFMGTNDGYAEANENFFWGVRIA